MDRSQGFQSSYNLKSPDMDRPMPTSQSMGAMSSMSGVGPTGGAVENADLASDPASSGFFATDYKKHEDLREMLDSNKDNLKLEAMKRIIGMVAKGKDVSDMFPAVVKNVVSKNAEVKKLVYVYLVRYAEEQQDLALLSISTFQRALKDPNQLIRASALRVLSSIRVSMIVPIMMLAIKEAVMDMSPYVRKTAAHAIPKLYNLDPEQKDVLLEVIEKLLADKTTLVAGSAIQAFEEVCPDNFELVHKNYRKLCSLLVDVEEWGQCVIINMLTRYARSQFIDPNKDDNGPEVEQPFYGSDDSDEDPRPQKSTYTMDPDHRLLLRTCKPLLNSRNASVVVAVAQLYHHCAPRGEIAVIPKALVRLLRSRKEVQYVVLSNIATVSTSRKSLFEPYLKSFYVRSCDPLPVKLLKLEILTNLATETSISTILRELQTYVTSSDKDFAAATIQAIGRCASSISEITDTCLSGLVSLMSNRDENVVAESVVVIKKLLQMQPSEHKAIITHMAKLVDNITVPMARASILWLIGEYSDRVPKIAPDVLRKAAKTFIQEEDIVKLQILNLSAKLCITNPKQTKLLSQYVFNLAKYDQNYDIRDRARFMRQLVLPTEGGTSLSKYAKKIFLASKPAPVLASNYKDRDQFQLGTLSHLLNNKAAGYRDLPLWPDVAPDPSVRNVEPPAPRQEPTKATKKAMKKKSFYSSSSGSSGESDSDENSSGSTEGADSPRSSASASEDESGSDKLSSSDKKSQSSDEDEEDSSDESSEGETSEASSSSEDEMPTTTTTTKAAPKSPQKHSKSAAHSTPNKPSTDLLLLDLDDFGSNDSAAATPVITPSSVLSPTQASEVIASPTEKAKPFVGQAAQAVFVPSRKYSLLNRVNGSGLSIDYRFTRSMSVFSPRMISIELELTNESDTTVTPISLTGKKLSSGMALSSFPDINNLDEGSSTSVTMGIDFNDTTQPASFDVSTRKHKYNLTINCPVGELLQPITMSEQEFNKLQGKLSGMNENKVEFDLPGPSDIETMNRRISEAANVLQVSSSDSDVLKYSAQTSANKTLVLVKAVLVDSGGTKSCKLVVNCEKMVIGSMLMKEVKTSLLK